MFSYGFHVTTYNNQRTIAITTINVGDGDGDIPLLSNKFLTKAMKVTYHLTLTIILFYFNCFILTAKTYIY